MLVFLILALKLLRDLNKLILWICITSHAHSEEDYVHYIYLQLV